MVQDAKGEVSGSFKYRIFFPLGIVLFSFAGSFLFFAFYSGLPLGDAFSVILHNLFPDPATNGFYGENFHVYLTLYSSMILMLGISSLVEFISHKLHKADKNDKRNYYAHDSFRLLVIFFAIIVFIQFVQHAKYFTDLDKHFSGKTLEEKQVSMFGFPYVFAMNCREHLDGSHTGKLVTDMDIRRATEMTIHRRLAYYLYPISIKHPKEGEQPDCLVFFNKKDAINHIPKGFTIQYKFDDNNIMTVRRDEK